MANKRNINRVIASIKGEIKATEKLGFNMGGYIESAVEDMTGRHCGTVACIAGHAHVLKTRADFEDMGKYQSDWGGSEVEENAMEYLGIDSSKAPSLFYGYGSGGSMDDITPEQAIRTLERLRDTGEVSWVES